MWPTWIDYVPAMAVIHVRHLPAWLLLAGLTTCTSMYHQKDVSTAVRGATFAPGQEHLLDFDDVRVARQLLVVEQLPATMRKCVIPRCC